MPVFFKTANISRSTNNVYFHDCPSKRGLAAGGLGARGGGRRPGTLPRAGKCAQGPGAATRGWDLGAGASSTVGSEQESTSLPGTQLLALQARLEGERKSVSTTEPVLPSPGG